MGRVTIRLDQHQRTPLLGGGPCSACTVLITGGLGALGVLLAGWLAKMSANLRLVLVCRIGRAACSAATAGSLQKVMSGAAGGSMFTICMGDASSAADAEWACTTDSNMQPPVQARPASCRYLRYNIPVVRTRCGGCTQPCFTMHFVSIASSADSLENQN